MASLSFLKLMLLMMTTLGNCATPLPPCNHIECPNYDVIVSGNGYEIRRYNTIVLVSTSPITDKGVTEATTNSFFK